MGRKHDLSSESPWEPYLDSEVGRSVGSSQSSLPDWLGAQRGSWADPPCDGPFQGPDLPILGGRYADLELIGKGATSSVYRAMDTLLRRPVALKLLHASGDGALPEAQAQARVEHPNVCRIYEVGSGFLVMQLLDGPTLADLAPNMDRSMALVFIRDVARGVHEAHLRGLLHLDLKLNNILTSQNLDGTLTPAVGDFGMTRLFGDPNPSRPCPLGTPPYTAPEQAARNLAALSPATDVYAMGVMLYILLSGKSPFGFTPQASLLETIVLGNWVPLGQVVPSLPKDLVSLVERCLKRDPAQRYGSAQALADDLDRLLAHEPLEVMGRAWGYQALKRIRKHRKLVLAFGIGVIPLSLVSTIGWRRGRVVVQQAAWDHRFQTLVKDLQVGLESAYRRPAHDIQPDLDAAQAVVHLIEREMAENGHAAKGPGHVALGQAALALGSEVDVVAQHFQAAWAEGYRTEEVRAWIETLKGLLEDSQGTDDRRPGAKGGPTSTSPSPRQNALVRFSPKTSLDQVRAAYLMRREGLDDEEEFRPERRLELARAYRQKAPNDIQAMLDEWDATMDQMRATWINLQEREGPRASVWDPSLESQRAGFRSLMAEGLLTAPSHPGIYLRLANAARDPLVKPWTTDSEAVVATREAREWYEQGFRVRFQDTALNEAFLDFLAWDALVSGSSVEEVRGEWERLLQDKPGLTSLAPPALLKHVEECEQRGIPSLVFGQDTLRRLRQLHGPGRGKVVQGVALASVRLAKLALMRGQDPTPLLTLVSESLGENPAGWPEASTIRLKATLVSKERDWLLGRKSKSAPDEIDLLTNGIVLDTETSLDLALYRCRTADTPEAWDHLAKLVHDLEDPSLRFMQCLVLPFFAPAKLALLEHQGSQGGTILEAMIAFKQRLRSLLEARKGNYNTQIHGLLAQVALLEGRYTASPATLRTGIREATIALAKAPRTTSQMETSYWAYGISPALLLKLKGKLWLALADLESSHLRGLFADKALASFLLAQKESPFLEASMAPLISQAWHLSASRTLLRRSSSTAFVH